MSKDAALSGRAREHLFSRVASMRKPEVMEKVETAEVRPAASKFTDFSTLPVCSRQ